MLSVTNRHHVTSHDRQAIVAGVEAGHRSFRTPRKTFRVTHEEGDTLHIQKLERRSNDFGRKCEDTTTFVVKVQQRQSEASCPN